MVLSWAEKNVEIELLKEKKPSPNLTSNMWLIQKIFQGMVIGEHKEMDGQKVVPKIL